MAKPRTPTNVLELSGAFKTNPSRRRARANEPKPEGAIGDPPASLSELEAMAWRELVTLCPAGVLATVDRPFLTYASRVYAAVQWSPQVDAKMGLRFESIIGRLGMTPADRSRVSAALPKLGRPSWEKFGPKGRS